MTSGAGQSEKRVSQEACVFVEESLLLRGRLFCVASLCCGGRCREWRCGWLSRSCSDCVAAEFAECLRLWFSAECRCLRCLLSDRRQALRLWLSRSDPEHVWRLRHAKSARCCLRSECGRCLLCTEAAAESSRCLRAAESTAESATEPAECTCSRRASKSTPYRHASEPASKAGPEAARCLAPSEVERRLSMRLLLRRDSECRLLMQWRDVERGLRWHRRVGAAGQWSEVESVGWWLRNLLLRSECGRRESLLLQL